MAWDWASAGGGAASGAGTGAMIGGAVGGGPPGALIGAGIGALVGGTAGGLMGGDEPETDFWDNYQNMLNQLRGTYRAQARTGVEQAARKSAAQLAGKGLSNTTSGTIRPNMIRALTGTAVNQADVAASQQALSAAKAGSRWTQADYSGLFSGVQSLGQSVAMMELLKSLNKTPGTGTGSQVSSLGHSWGTGLG